MVRVYPPLNQIKECFGVCQNLVRFALCGNCRAGVINLVSLPPAGIEIVGRDLGRFSYSQLCSLEGQVYGARERLLFDIQHKRSPSWPFEARRYKRWRSDGLPIVPGLPHRRDHARRADESRLIPGGWSYVGGLYCLEAAASNSFNLPFRGIVFPFNTVCKK